MTDYPALLAGILAFFVFPLWLAAGLADYFCHRRSDIEHTSGVPENLMHLLQALQVGIALLAGLFLEINALVLLIIIGAVLAHTVTAVWDIAYTSPRRHISAFEQHVHSHLELLPIMAVALVIALHWPQFAGLFGAVEPPSFTLQWKEPPLPRISVTVILLLVLAVLGLPLIDESRRVVRARRSERKRPVHV